MHVNRLLVLLILFGFFTPAEAQEPKKIPRIGFLIAGSSSSYSGRVEAFRQGLRELGYVEGQNIIIEYRYAGGQENRLADIAVELVRLKVEVIVATGTLPQNLGTAGAALLI